ncbi:MAG: GxxExxY protein [Candidatus Hydrogenedentes bacterium]|nr:GxxExxY protein [Candidatus Hydrogenedentota bacterium]
MDLIVEDKVIVDNKANSELTPIDKQQFFIYLRLNDLRLGLLINFYVSKLVEGIHRVVNNLDE